MRKSNLVVANEILSRRAKRSKIEFFLYGTLLTATHPTFASELTEEGVSFNRLIGLSRRPSYMHLRLTLLRRSRVAVQGETSEGEIGAAADPAFAKSEEKANGSGRRRRRLSMITKGG